MVTRLDENIKVGDFVYANRRYAIPKNQLTYGKADADVFQIIELFTDAEGVPFITGKFLSILTLLI